MPTTQPECGTQTAPLSAGAQSRIQQLKHRYLRIVDACIPEAIRSDPVRLRRARTVLGFTLVLIPLGFETVVFFAWTLPTESASPINLALAAALCLTLAVPWSFRYTQSATLGGHLVLAASYLVISISLAVTGGVRGPLMHWLGILPLLAGLMSSRGAALQWAIVSAFTFGGFVVADSLDFRMQTEFLVNVSGPLLWVQRSVDVCSWLVVLLAAGLLYEGHTLEQTRELVATNVELESEIGQRREAEEKTYYLAHYDELTNLPNRRLFNQLMQRANENSRREGRKVGILFLDLDGFKSVNDSYGHGEGDILLKEVARRLQACVRLSDSVTRGREGRGNREDRLEVVSRLGGDEFTILLDGLRNHGEAATVARRVNQSLRDPIPLSEREVHISASIGVAIQSDEREPVEELLRRADLAMYHAKEAGKNRFHFFEESMNADVQKRSELIRDLAQALEARQFALEFQPIVDAATHRVVCVEALVRWRHPQRGTIAPADFIEIAESTGQMVEIGNWVLHEACRRFAEWREAGIAPRRIAVNVSALQFRRGDLPDAVASALHESGVPARHLELEITETAMMADEEETARCLRVVKDMGVRLTLDDFGTGYSSLSYLKRFPVDSLKIDQSFVRDLTSTPDAQAIAQAMISLAHEIGLTVVGEGVETPSQHRFLVKNGCDELQGYRFSRPLDEKQILPLLERGVIDPDEAA